MAKPFGGKQSKNEEMAEAKALKSGKISKEQYVKGEMSEGHGKDGAKKRADAIKSGKMSPKQYAEKHGGVAGRKGFADGGMAGGMYSGCSGTGRRVHMDAGK